MNAKDYKREHDYTYMKCLQADKFIETKPKLQINKLILHYNTNPAQTKT